VPEPVVFAGSARIFFFVTRSTVVTSEVCYGPQCRQTGEAFLKESSFHYTDLISAQFHYMSSTLELSAVRITAPESQPLLHLHMGCLSVDTRVTQQSDSQCDSAGGQMLQTLSLQCVN